MILASALRLISDMYGRWQQRRKRRHLERNLSREMQALPHNVRHDLNWPGNDRVD
ncbi:hypothetical protein [Rhizobium sp. RU36D]|uniref:hypothetical protein n=1 Tax=Rhizobium sp. RU36D TaxID=1907415 RepID=UPI0009D7A4A4|nr:hypothetical protein [Rhizobium sp. RU36D]SMD14496.1 hypothetical protein SAMN05880593_12632 [Rhizobium sp. RU36D]